MPRSSAVLAHPNSQPYGSDGRMFFIAKSTSSATQSLITGFPTPSIMKTSRQQTSQGGKDKSTYSQEASLANLSVQQDGDLERTMTATSGQRCYESSGRYSPLSSFRKWDWLLTPGASDGMRTMMTMDNLKGHRKKNVAQSNLSEQIAHKIGGRTSQLSPLFVEEMMGYPLIYLVLPFLLQDGDRNR